MAARTGRTGRPSDLTPELIERISPFLRAGNLVETACAAAGISRESLYDWLRTGAAAARKTGRLTEHQARCLHFSDTVARLQAEATVTEVAGITAAGRQHERTITTIKRDAENNETERTVRTEEVDGDWRALLALLERRERRFNVRVSAEVEDQDRVARHYEDEPGDDPAAEIVLRIRGMRDRMGGNGAATTDPG